jgi:hypothetical protein
MLELLNSNKASFYDLFTNPANEISDILEAMREYFLPEAFENLTFKRTSESQTWEFESSDKYLEKIFLNFFRFLPKEHLLNAVHYLCNPESSPSEWIILLLSERLAFNPVDSKEMLKEHILNKEVFTREDISHFEYNPSIEAILAARTYGNNYNVGYTLTEDAASFTAFSLASKYSNNNIEDMPSKYVVNSISLDLEAIKSENYFCSPSNLTSILEALNGLKEGKPAFLICSNKKIAPNPKTAPNPEKEDTGHWATIGLVRAGNTLHVLGFDSNQSSMSDEFKKQLIELIEKTDLFTDIDSSYTFPKNVQYGNNCGLASALFIATVASELEKGLDIASLKDNLQDAYLSKIGHPNSAQTWVNLVAEAVSLDHLQQLSAQEEASVEVYSEAEISDGSAQEQQEAEDRGAYDKAMGKFSLGLIKHLSGGHVSLVEKEQNLEASR